MPTKKTANPGAEHRHHKAHLDHLLKEIHKLCHTIQEQGEQIMSDFSKLQASTDALTAAVAKLPTVTNDQPTIDAITQKVDAATAAVNSFVTPPTT